MIFQQFDNVAINMTAKLSEGIKNFRMTNNLTSFSDSSTS